MHGLAAFPNLDRRHISRSILVAASDVAFCGESLACRMHECITIPSSKLAILFPNEHLKKTGLNFDSFLLLDCFYMESGSISLCNFLFARRRPGLALRG